LSTSKVLVVYYSRTGTTRKAAEALKQVLKADIEEIIDKKNRGGPIGWLMAGRDAGNKTLTELFKLSHDPNNYDLVVIGSPVWNDTVSTPIRTYINRYRSTLSKVAFFTTQDTEKTKASRDIEEILGREPVASIQLMRKKDVDSGKLHEKLKAYSEAINQSLHLDNLDTQAVEAD
jgi:menaquinone-dependent protoporphyrinogen IX oxidase